ncbi:DNA phosphorothioation system sulfurtransferase DndC [Halalkalibacter urbisdiaboli]|uniref:DNA phosphorothioation system sulfurtransferase DndC n=1 Tax=Halalkalibacter urbisdiaboli TaxID=1960589 RepID=UPI000B42E078|nr:DNA phosphorothioation system sulfurtransferase DndC [Halalkalibacter urbisdiaboli]
MINNLITNLIQKKNPIIDDAIQLIKDVYLQDINEENPKPWVVGYSGGKDSSTVVQLIFEALTQLSKEQLHKKIYIISSDTLVETPLIISFINRTLQRIQDRALELNLPIETHKVKPNYKQSFWSMLIGQGYPSPNQNFRWCTDRLKIEPANRFITEKVSEHGEVIMVLGMRDNESATRANVMKSYTVEGKVLMRHSTLTKALVFAPIRNFSVDDVWNYLNNHESPWGDDNKTLQKLYQDSSSDAECPLVIDKSIKESAGSCGNSRFGCWTCTVVTEDKAVKGFIDNGEEWLKPLLSFRDWLVDIRDERIYRQKYRKNGQIYFTDVTIETKEDKAYVVIPKKSRRSRGYIPLENFEIVKKEKLKEYLLYNNIDLSDFDDTNLLIESLDDDGKVKYERLGLGPFTMVAREMILRKLLQLQNEVEFPDGLKFDLIKKEELKIIRKIWLDNGELHDKLPQIFAEEMGYDLDWEYNDRPLFDSNQLTDLELLCQEHNVDFKALKSLISIQKQYNGYKIRRGIYQDIEKALKQDYLHL